nr:hypothetical protein GCM10020092_013050 [Actinoplanes digitatis]
MDHGGAQRQILIFGGIAGGILAIGLTVILIVALTSGGDPFGGRPAAVTDLRPPLAQMCPAPTVPPSAAPVVPPSAVPLDHRRADDRQGVGHLLQEVSQPLAHLGHHVAGLARSRCPTGSASTS